MFEKITDIAGTIANYWDAYDAVLTISLALIMLFKKK
jgi:hypothetical protein